MILKYLSHLSLKIISCYFFCQNINVPLKIYFHQRYLHSSHCSCSSAVCAECDANLIRNSEEICFQRHFYSKQPSSHPALEKAQLQVLRQSKLFPNYFHTNLLRFPNPDIFNLLLLCSLISSLQLQNFLFRSLLSMLALLLFAIFFAPMCIDPVTS